MLSLKQLIENPGEVFSGLTAAQKTDQTNALSYIEMIAARAKVNLDGADILSIFKDKTAKKLNKIVIEPNEINKRLFEYNDRTKAMREQEAVADLVRFTKKYKIKSKPLIDKLTAVVKAGVWKPISVDDVNINFINTKDIIAYSEDGTIYNFGTFLVKLSKKTLHEKIVPFKNNLQCYDDVNIYPYVFDYGSICFGNASQYIGAARKAKNLPEVLNIIYVALSAYSEAGGPVYDIESFQEEMSYVDYFESHEDDGLLTDEQYEKITKTLEEKKMTYEAYKHEESQKAVIEVSKRDVQALLKTKKKMKAIANRVSENFIDNMADEDEEY